MAPLSPATASVSKGSGVAPASRLAACAAPGPSGVAVKVGTDWVVAVAAPNARLPLLRNDQSCHPPNATKTINASPPMAANIQSQIGSPRSLCFGNQFIDLYWLTIAAN